ncbi:hypothetical protein DRN63_02570 [Nanoarchaeota archaeon]|nr:MAG: hypothetical protein DRN63_02570 [Nanoarchaeota archaeon]
MEVAPLLGKPENKRAIRGYAIIAKGDEPKQIKENVFKVLFQKEILRNTIMLPARIANGTALARITNRGKLHANISTL